MEPTSIVSLIINGALLYQLAACEDTRPHIVLIVADDLGWDDVGFHNSEIPTPNIDALAYSGIILDNYYVQPICTPTRSALMTGRYPIHTGMQHGVLVGSQPYGLPLEEKLLPQYLNELGYASHMVGKWHLGFYAKEYTPTFRGFQSHFGYYQGMEDYWDHTYASKGTVPKTWGLDFRRNMDLVKSDFGKYSTELFTNEAEQIIARHNESQPLFLYLPHQAVHSGNPYTPLEAPWKYLQKVQHIKDNDRRLFGGMVAALDDAVGNVTRALHEKGMLKNSIIIFTTDNGGPPAGFDFNQACNWPLRGTKTQLWEGGVRGTGFVWSAKLLKAAGSVSRELTHCTDWLPTILHAAGYNTKKLSAKLDGVNQWDTLFKGKKSQRKDILLNIDSADKYAAYRHGDWKVIIGENSWGKHWSGWYKADFHHKDRPVTEGPRLYPSSHRLIPESDAQSSFVNTHTTMNILLEMGWNQTAANPVMVNCGKKPANASTNCQPVKEPCLFNVAADPCEYNNVAWSHPDILKELLSAIQSYNATAVPPRNKAQDSKGWPVYHDWAWVPWVNLTTEPEKLV